MDARSCPVCSTPYGTDWPLLGRHVSGGDPVATHVCPGCTLAWTGRPSFRVDAGYRGRVCSLDVAGLLEHDDGRVGLGPAAHRQAIAAGRIADLERAFAAVQTQRRIRALQVGVRDASWFTTARRGRRVNAVAVEPWGPWASSARALDIDVHQQPLEGWRKRGSFDLIVEHDVLPHLCDPMAHLRAIAGRLAPGGVALIEVPNLLEATGASAQDILSATRPFWFTPRALVTACKRAGLAPFQLAVDARLRVWCRAAPPVAITVAGPSADDVVETVGGNDLRLHLKRALFRMGATPTSMQLAATIHGRCSRAAVRADLAIEIATACERSSDLDSAAYWLEVSLRDRDDVQVAQTLGVLQSVRRRVQSLWLELPAANGPMPAPTLRLVS